MSSRSRAPRVDSQVAAEVETRLGSNQYDKRDRELVALDRAVDRAEGDGIMARWQFGCDLLTEVVGKQLPVGRLDKVATLIGKSTSEVRFRMLFAKRFPTRQEVVNAVNDFRSWHRIVNEALASTAHLSAKKDEWSTPDDLYAALDAEFGFTLDPCASDFNHKTTKYYTKADDGLFQDWSGHTVFMNPPYSTVDEWMAKAHLAGINGTTVVALVPSRTDVAWFWDHARHGQLRFIRGRVWFIDDEGNTGPAPFPSVVVVFGLGTSVEWWDFE